LGKGFVSELQTGQATSSREAKKEAGLEAKQEAKSKQNKQQSQHRSKKHKLNNGIAVMSAGFHTPLQRVFSFLAIYKLAHVCPFLAVSNSTCLANCFLAWPLATPL